MRRENRRRDNRNARQLHRIWKSALGAALAAALVLGGLDTGSYSTLINVEAAGESQGQLKTVYLNGSGSDGDGTTKETAVNSFSKAVSLAAEGASVLVCGTVNITGETQLSMPSGITVKKADGFTGPIVKVTGQGKLRITYGWLNSADVDVSGADLGQDAFVIGEEKKEEPKEEVKEEATEEPKDQEQAEPEIEQKEEPDAKQPALEVAVPGSLTMAEPVSLSSLNMGEGFGGDGTFRFAEPDKVPDTYESSQQVIFTPNDSENYDYSQTDGWSPEGQEVVRYITIYVESLKEPEPPVQPEEEPEAPKEDNTAKEPPVQEPEKEQPETEQPEKEQPDTEEPEKEQPEKGQPEAEQPKTETPEEENTEKQPEKESEAEEGKQDTAAKEDENKTDVDNKEENKKEDVNAEDKKDEGNKTEDEKPEDKKPSDVDSENVKEPVGSLVDKASGIEVSGDFIPSYVEIRVTKNEAAQDIPDNRIEKVLNSYDIELWNLKTDSKYIIPDGKKVTVKIPVPDDAELFGTLIIAHYKPDKGEYEYFVPNQNLMIENGYLVFETDSFSPFNVGGGNQLVGIGTTSPNHKPSGGSSTGSGTRAPGSGSSLLGNNGNNSSPVINRPTITSSRNSGSRTTVVNPRTGDETPIVTYVLIAAAAVVIIIILLVLGKKKKK